MDSNPFSLATRENNWPGDCIGQIYTTFCPPGPPPVSWRWVCCFPDISFGLWWTHINTGRHVFPQVRHWLLSQPVQSAPKPCENIYFVGSKNFPIVIPGLFLARRSVCLGAFGDAEHFCKCFHPGLQVDLPGRNVPKKHLCHKEGGDVYQTFNRLYPVPFPRMSCLLTSLPSLRHHCLYRVPVDPSSAGSFPS